MLAGSGGGKGELGLGVGRHTERQRIHRVEEFVVRRHRRASQRAGQLGSGYTLPDNLWIANWNGQKNTLDPAVPSTGWALHQRIHQYQGGHNESYGGVTINIDNNYVDAATVGEGAAPAPGEEDPIGELNLTSAPEPGMVRIKGWAFDPNMPTYTSAIRVVVGGKVGTPGAEEYDLGEIANIARGAVAVEHPEAGPNHGFDTRVATTASVSSGPSISSASGKAFWGRA